MSLITAYVNWRIKQKRKQAQKEWDYYRWLKYR